MIVSVIGGTGPQGLGIALRLAIEGVEVVEISHDKGIAVIREAKEVDEAVLKEAIEAKDYVFKGV